MNMQKYLKPQVAAIQPSVIRKFFDLAAKMEGVVSLGIGEPDFSTPLPFCEAGWRSMQQGKTGYIMDFLLSLRLSFLYYLGAAIWVMAPQIRLESWLIPSMRTVTLDPLGGRPRLG